MPCSRLFLPYTFFSSLYLMSHSRSLRRVLSFARNCFLVLVLLLQAVHITLFYRARHFSEEAEDCSENNITATNLVKSASGDFQCTGGEEEKRETARSLPARKSKLDKTFLDHTHTHTHKRTRAHTHTHNCTCFRQSFLDT